MDFIDKITLGDNTLDNTVVLSPFHYVETLPSQNHNVRTKFLHAFNNKYYHIQNPHLLSWIDKLISTLHNASLIIDDIEDLSPVRRGSPTAHVKFGVPLALNSANMAYFTAMDDAIQAAKIYSPTNSSQVLAECVEIIVKEMLNLHHGQGLDIFWRDFFGQKPDFADPPNPSVEDYLVMVMNKTGGLFRLSVKLLDVFSNHSNRDQPQLLRLANLLGIIYQIRDDYMNLESGDYASAKGMGAEDLVEGKLSLPVLHSMGSHEYLVNFFKNTTREQREGSPELVERALECLQETRSLEYTKEVFLEYVERAKLVIADDECDLMKIVNVLAKV